MKELVIVCAWCERVRTEGGRWHEQNQAVYEELTSHGICPDCVSEVLGG